MGKLGLLVFQENLINEICGSQYGYVVYTISGWSSSRDVISVSRGVATGNSRCIKQFAKKISAEFVAPV